MSRILSKLQDNKISQKRDKKTHLSQTKKMCVLFFNTFFFSNKAVNNYLFSLISNKNTYSVNRVKN